MKYSEARQLFKETRTVPYGWYYCSIHKDVESKAEPCPEAFRTGQARPLGAMKWQPTDAGMLQCLVEDGSNHLHRHLGEAPTPPEDMQPPVQKLASLAGVP
jgi:hypothetical protein